MPHVFLNYRREDSEGIAGRIFDRLRVHFGPDNVFRDLDTIAPGAEFASVIGEEIAKCDALIAIIGNEWLEAKDAEGKRRLDSPRDFVRTEIAEALSRNKLVIPTLVEGARMPDGKDLPTEIASLAERNAIEISAARFEHDMERLVKGIAGERQVAATSSQWRWISDPNHQRTLGFIGAFIAALAAGGWQLYVHFSADSKQFHQLASRSESVASPETLTRRQDRAAWRSLIPGLIPPSTSASRSRNTKRASNAGNKSYARSSPRPAPPTRTDLRSWRKSSPRPPQSEKTQKHRWRTLR